MKLARFDTLIAGLEGRGFSRSEIALQTGLSRKTIWRLATGEAREPGFETIERLRLFDQKTAVSPMTQKIG